MTDPATAGFGTATAVALVASGVFLVSMWRRRSEPLARPLLGVACVSVLSVLVHAALVRDFLHETAPGIWIFAVYVFSLTAMGLWIYFTFQYTGRGRRVTRLVGTAIATMVGVTLLTAVVAPVVWPGDGDQLINIVTGLSTLAVQALTIVSLFVLLDETTGSTGHLFRESLAHTGGILLFGFAPFVAGILQEPTVVPAMVAAGSLFFLVAIHRYALFETLPVALVAGRDRVINEMADPVVVVDRTATVQDLNRAAEDGFGVERSTAVGRPLAGVVPGPTEPAIIAESVEPVPLETPDGRALSVTADRVTDSRGRLFGHLLLYRDITERRDRERRLSVLNQLLVGAVRERMETAAAAARALQEEDRKRQDPEQVGETVWGITTELTRLVTRAREVEGALSGHETGETDLLEAVRTAAGEGAVGSLDLPEEGCQVALSRSLLEMVLSILFRDVFPGTAVDVVVATEHDGPTLRVTPSRDPAAARDVARPRGGSIDEFAVELAGVAVEHAGGSLSVLDADLEGRGVLLRLPPCEQRGQETDGERAGDRRTIGRMEGIQ